MLKGDELMVIMPSSNFKCRPSPDLAIIVLGSFVMVTLCNRADHNIFMLFLLSSSSLFFPRLISAVGDWMFTILWHMVRP